MLSAKCPTFRLLQLTYFRVCEFDKQGRVHLGHWVVEWKSERAWLVKHNKTVRDMEFAFIQLCDEPVTGHAKKKLVTSHSSNLE